MSTTTAKRSKRILMVDDEPDSIEAVKYRLMAKGYVVQCATDGTSGIQIAKREQPDVIILDVMMPTPNGSDTAQALRQDPETRHIPILFLSCISEALDVDQTFHTPTGEWLLPKPFESKKLLDLIEQIIEEPTAQ